MSLSAVRVIRHALATRGGVGGIRISPSPAGVRWAPAFEVLLRACQPGEEPHNRQFPRRSLWWHEGGEAHIRARRFRAVPEYVLCAAEAACGRDNIGGRVGHQVLHLWV